MWASYADGLTSILDRGQFFRSAICYNAGRSLRERRSFKLEKLLSINDQGQTGRVTFRAKAIGNCLVLSSPVLSCLVGMSSRVVGGVCRDVRAQGGRISVGRRRRRSLGLLAQDLSLVGRLCRPSLYPPVVVRRRQAASPRRREAASPPGRAAALRAVAVAGRRRGGDGRQGRIVVVVLSTGRTSAAAEAAAAAAAL